MYIMIKTQVIKKGKDPIAVIIDYKEYLRLKEMAQDRAGYAEAITREKNPQTDTSQRGEKASGTVNFLGLIYFVEMKQNIK